MGPAHNYYDGRARAGLSQWIQYFLTGMAEAFEKVRSQLRQESESGATDQSDLLRKLDQRQQRAPALFCKREAITAGEMGALLGSAPRTARFICARWAERNFLVIANPSRKARSYRLAAPWASLVG